MSISLSQAYDLVLSLVLLLTAVGLTGAGFTRLLGLRRVAVVTLGVFCGVASNVTTPFYSLEPLFAIAYVFGALSFVQSAKARKEQEEALKLLLGTSKGEAP